MNLGRTVFAQLMDHLPSYEFQKCVSCYQGDARLRGFSTDCAADVAERCKRASAIKRSRSKSSSEPMRWLSRICDEEAAAKSVQSPGISDLLPSGRIRTKYNPSCPS